MKTIVTLGLFYCIALASSSPAQGLDHFTGTLIDPEGNNKNQSFSYITTLSLCVTKLWCDTSLTNISSEAKLCLRADYPDGNYR